MLVVKTGIEELRQKSKVKVPLLSATIPSLCILAQVNNSAKLPMFLLGAVKDPQELAQGHVPGAKRPQRGYPTDNPICTSRGGAAGPSFAPGFTCEANGRAL